MFWIITLCLQLEFEKVESDYLELSAKVQKSDKGYLYCNSEAVIIMILHFTYDFKFAANIVFVCINILKDKYWKNGVFFLHKIQSTLQHIPPISIMMSKPDFLTQAMIWCIIIY